MTESVPSSSIWLACSELWEEATKGACLTKEPVLEHKSSATEGKQ